jgi:TolB protein
MRHPRHHLAILVLAICIALLALVPAAIAADQGLIVFQSVRREADGTHTQGVYSISPDGKELRRIALGEEPTVSRDGKQIAFVKKFRIYVGNSDGTDVRQVTDADAIDTEPAFSPDGKEIVFVRQEVDGKDREGPGRIYVMDADGSDAHAITKPETRVREPAFSPDGKKIAFIHVTGNFQLATIDADGKDLTDINLPDEVAGPLAPSYSPNGKRILFGGRVGTGKEVGQQFIYTVDPDGTDLKQVQAGLEPAFSPNGSEIVFSRDEVVYTMSADGGDVRRLTSDNLEIHSTRPSWGR